MTRYIVKAMFGDATTAYKIGEIDDMPIFNDKTASPDEEKEMQQLKDGVSKAKTRLQEGREMPVADEVDKRAKAKSKKGVRK